MTIDCLHSIAGKSRSGYRVFVDVDGKRFPVVNVEEDDGENAVVIKLGNCDTINDVESGEMFAYKLDGDSRVYIKTTMKRVNHGGIEARCVDMRTGELVWLDEGEEIIEKL